MKLNENSTLSRVADQTLQSWYQAIAKELKIFRMDMKAPNSHLTFAKFTEQLTLI